MHRETHPAHRITEVKPKNRKSFSGLKDGTPAIYRTRIAVTNGLRKKLKELMIEFQELNHVDLLSAAFISPRNSAILLSHHVLSVHLHSNLAPNWCFCEENMLPIKVVDNGLATLATGCPNLRRLHVISASQMGLLSIAEEHHEGVSLEL
ncbi:hypothetical protein V8G54_035490 [Vigna mungo]|uniref:Syntaxin N-terminal domain-containing protein n=1 Tax=Vigna mungo TaxID=3915 RepID=A0AAQ3MFI1_VIGMU